MLKQQPGNEIQVEGSATLVDTLIQADLVDEYKFFIHPVIAGTGKRFFKEGKLPGGLKLSNTEVLDKGVVVLTYQREKA
jgi:dihydrofolate reductase